LQFRHRRALHGRHRRHMLIWRAASFLVGLASPTFPIVCNPSCALPALSRPVERLLASLRGRPQLKEVTGEPSTPCLWTMCRPRPLASPAQEAHVCSQTLQKPRDESMTACPGCACARSGGDGTAGKGAPCLCNSSGQRSEGPQSCGRDRTVLKPHRITSPLLRSLPPWYTRPWQVVRIYVHPWGKTFSRLSTPRAGVGRDVADAVPDSIAQAFSQGPALTRPAWPLPLGQA